SACAGQVATELNRQLLGWIFHPLVLRALLVGRILPVLSLLAPCGAGASAPSVRRRNYATDHSAPLPYGSQCPGRPFHRSASASRPVSPSITCGGRPWVCQRGTRKSARSPC